MNIFRLVGDFSHLTAILILLFKIWKTRSCAGVSGKSVVLYGIVFTCRYLDLFVNYISAYNTSMKIIYLVSTYLTIYLIYRKFRLTYDRNHDAFRVEILLLPAAVLAFVWNHDFTVLEILWTFSIYLEAVAILPQLYMVSQTGEAETITSHYLFALGLYRFLYILNWIYRYYTENYLDWISIVAGVVQTVLYADFFYIYITRVVLARRSRPPETI